MAWLDGDIYVFYIGGISGPAPRFISIHLMVSTSNEGSIDLESRVRQEAHLLPNPELPELRLDRKPSEKGEGVQPGVEFHSREPFQHLKLKEESVGWGMVCWSPAYIRICGYLILDCCRSKDVKQRYIEGKC